MAKDDIWRGQVDIARDGAKGAFGVDDRVKFLVTGDRQALGSLYVDIAALAVVVIGN